jgi:hypothetical protein
MHKLGLNLRRDWRWIAKKPTAAPNVLLWRSVDSPGALYEAEWGGITGREARCRFRRSFRREWACAKLRRSFWVGPRLSHPTCQSDWHEM